MNAWNGKPPILEDAVGALKPQAASPRQEGGRVTTTRSPLVRVVRAQFPEAIDVWLLGEFNHWSTTDTPMMRVGAGTWEAHLEASAPLGRVWFFVFDAGERFGHLVRGASSDTEWHNA
jgi:hypothetical protein